MIRKRFYVRGRVQGVGFRPFASKLAHKLSLSGFVHNTPTGVTLELQGLATSVELFEEELLTNLPPLAHIESIKNEILSVQEEGGFFIIDSLKSQEKTITMIPSDIATCHNCLADIRENGKYKGYFATSCSDCGPRYSIINALPFDRKNTSMHPFELCDSCKEEYGDSTNRRYHTQAIACPVCGPKLSLWEGDHERDVQDIFSHVASLLEEKKIVAIKGMGGFHLVCDARDDAVISRLREAKNRPSKPFALMCKDYDEVAKIACVTPKEKEFLLSDKAPIVLLEKKQNTSISSLVAPHVKTLGCMVAYTPLHHLLFEKFPYPIVATSANRAGEPIATTKEQIQERLPFVAYIVDFNREIVRGVDDSLVQVIAGKKQILRLGRGEAPKVFHLPTKSKKNILAVGANGKNTLAFVFDQYLIVSPHVGDIESVENFTFFQNTIQSFRDIYHFTPDLLVCDKHPSYFPSRWAREQKYERIEMGHHLAHIYACKAEYGLVGAYVGCSFDGSGYGDDGALWGGEIFVGDERKYSFTPLKLLGGEKAAREPRRIALSLLFEALCLEEVLALDLACVRSFSQEEIKLLHQSFSKDLNSFRTSSVGRLFDAVASFSSLAQKISYEGESGLLCESLYDPTIEEAFAFSIKEGLIRISLVEEILQDSLKAEQIVSRFFNTLIAIILTIAKKEKKALILSGGVFQNKTLMEKLLGVLQEEKIEVYYQQESPINDGGIALGGAYYAYLQQL